MRGTNADDYRPIKFLNDDHKLLARIIARHLRTLLADYLWKTQFCGVPGNTILDVVATARDAIAQLDMTHTLLCVLSLDFREAFDKSCTSIPIHHSQSLRPTGELCRSHKAYVLRCHLHSTNQRTHRRHRTPSVLRPTRLSIDYGTFRLVHQPIATLS